ncbi:MAG: sigma-70 family RNA polymerase sigma factor [Paludibacteraceae bacterium]|nr:sigma-70 family RNA polymerase sigma factor [Paludibacteraceae bacterium]
MTHEQFTATYLPFSGKMYALAYNLLRNRDEARDCVQDVYAELWNKRDSIEPDKPPLALLLTMVRNNCLDRLKARYAEPNEEIIDTFLDYNTENRIEAASDLSAIIELIKQLPRDQQLVLRLRTIDGLEIEQIQELTHFSRENIYTLLSRARKKLRELTATYQI